MYYVYMLTSWNNKVLYTGVTNNLERRMYEHKNKLVYFESTSDIKAAITREKQIKGWTRAKKNALIENLNPEWRDLTAIWDS